MDDILTYRHVTVCYGEKNVIKDVSFSLKRGEILGIVGESGSGKSTLLRAAMGLLGRGGCVTRGDLYFRYEGGEFCDLPDLGDTKMRALRGKHLAMIHQDPGASLCPVRRIVDLAFEAGRAHGIYGRGRQEKRRCAADLADLFETFGLEDPEHILAAYPFELSGGMLQRAVVAMTLLEQPSVILADEPTSALDVISAERVADELMRVRELCRTAVLFVTHNIALAAHVTDRLLILRDGTVQELGETAEIMRHSDSSYTKELLEAVPKLKGKS